jgi:hypothetical protein
LKPAYSARVADLQSELAYLAMLSGHLPEARTNIDAAARLERLRAANPDDAELLMLTASVAMSQGDSASTKTIRATGSASISSPPTDGRVCTPQSDDVRPLPPAPDVNPGCFVGR